MLWTAALFSARRLIAALDVALCLSPQADTAIAVPLSRSISEQHTASMNRLFSLFCMGIRIHNGYAPLGSWCHTTPPLPNGDPTGLPNGSAASGPRRRMPECSRDYGVLCPIGHNKPRLLCP